MKKILFRYVAILIAFSMFCSFQIGSLEHAIVKALKDNNAKEIAKYFNSSLSLQINQRSSISTKYQAELVLADFLKNNKVLEVSSSNSNKNSQGKSYFILEVKTDKKKYNFFLKTIELKDDVLISEFKVN